MEITPLLKDEILSFICEKYPPEHYQGIDIPLFYKTFSIDFDVLHAILNQFNDIGLITNLSARRVEIAFITRLYAVDFLSEGGFQGNFDILNLNKQKLYAEVQKLQLEIQELTKTSPETPLKSISFERILNLVGNIASIASLMAK